ncbi:hypothetical protein XENORESO_021593, partial [Xenotaenia resolanae]
YLSFTDATLLLFYQTNFAGCRQVPPASHRFHRTCPPPPLTSDPVLAPYYHSLLHTPGLEPSYSPHCVLIPVSLNPSPPGGELTQP